MGKNAIADHDIGGDCLYTSSFEFLRLYEVFCWGYTDFVNFSKDW